MSSAVLQALQKSTENNFILNETFNLFSLISFESLPIDIIIKYIRQLDQNVEKQDIYLAIKHCSLFLLNENENDVRMHRIVHEATEVLRKRDRVYDVAKALYSFKDRDDEIKILPHLKSFNLASKPYLLDPNGSVLSNHESAEMLFYFAKTLSTNYQSKLALDFLNVNLQNSKKSEIDLVNIYLVLGETHYHLGEYTKSEDYHQQAIDIQMNILGLKHIDVATSYSYLGLVYQAMGELEQAKDYHQRAIDIEINILGANHINVATCYGNLGLVHQAMGELEQAKDYHQRAMDIRVNLLGPNHISVATSYNNLGIVCKAMGQLELAKDYHQRAMDIRMNLLGLNHINLATS